MRPEEVADKARAAKTMRLIQLPRAAATLRTPDGQVVPVPLGGEWRAASTKGATSYMRALEDFEVVTRAFGVGLGADELSPDAFIESSEHLRILACIASGEEAPSEVRFIKADAPPGVGLGDHVAFLFPFVLPFPQKTLVVAS